MKQMFYVGENPELYGKLVEVEAYGKDSYRVWLAGIETPLTFIVGSACLSSLAPGKAERIPVTMLNIHSARMG